MQVVRLGKCFADQQLPTAAWRKPSTSTQEQAIQFRYADIRK